VPGGLYYNLRRATRTRRKFISRRTASQNVITGLVDQLFPGLWDKDDSIFSERWGKGSLLVIERYPTPKRILRLGEARLARFLRKNNTKLTDRTARKIISAARCTLVSCNPLEQTMDIFALRSHLKVYRLYQEIIMSLENEIAHLLVQSPGVYLLSIPGISVTYAAEIIAEIGDISRFAYASVSLLNFSAEIMETKNWQQFGEPGYVYTK